MERPNPPKMLLFCKVLDHGDINLEKVRKTMKEELHEFKTRDDSKWDGGFTMKWTNQTKNE